MNLIGSIVLLTLSVLSVCRNNHQEAVSYTVTLQETGCASTRRMRCSYHFVEVSAERAGKDRRHFNIVFYLGADLAKEKEDAISRLNRLFDIEREVSVTPGVANTGRVGYKKPVRLQIQGTKYEFSREDGENIVVDIEKKTRP